MADHPAQLTFYIPSDLEASAPRASSRFSCLETLIARGNTTSTSLTGDAQLLALFGCDTTGGTARAAVSHHAQHGSADHEQWRIIASPVHLLADHATLHFPAQHSLLNDEESRALMDTCQDHFAEEGWQLDYGDVNTWYLSVSHSTGITTTALDDAIGKPLFEGLPKGNNARIWRRWSNEVQMLFHTHAVNEVRHGRGVPPINSLWFWGEGRLPSLLPERFIQVYGGDGYVQGLARLSGAQWSSLPDGIAAMNDGDHGPVLIVLDNANQPSWDSDWFSPLANKLRMQAISSMGLHFRNGYATRLDGKSLWRFWRRKRFSVVMTGQEP